jgi:hypothetical protein
LSGILLKVIAESASVLKPVNATNPILSSFSGRTIAAALFQGTPSQGY